MPIPLLVIVGQQIFRMAATAAAKKAIKAVGGRIVKEVPKAFAKKRVGNEGAFTKLVKEKKPSLQDKIGNLFTKKPNRVTQKSPGRTNKAEGINVGTVRQAASKRGDKVAGAAGTVAAVGVPSALAIAKLRTNLKKAKTEKARIQAQKDIDNAVAKVVLAEEKAKNKSSAPSKSKRPQTRKTLAPSKSQRPKRRPKK